MWTSCKFSTGFFIKYGVRDAYDWIRAGAGPEAKSAALPTFEDGYRSTCVIDAILRSHAAGGVWQAVSTAAYVRSDA